MSWTYSDWITQTTRKTRLSRLRLHIQEVADEISAQVNSDGVSYNPAPLSAYLKTLQSRETALSGRDGKMIARSKIIGGGR